MNASDNGKRAAAEAAIGLVEEGMLLGLGTGSTVAYAITALGRRVAQGLTVDIVPTSKATETAARTVGLNIVPMDNIGQLDLCIDGIDEIDPAFRAIKGAGGAMLREKIVATAAARMIAIADASKTVDQLGSRPVPVEILEFARGLVEREVRALGADAVLRANENGPVSSDQGNLILDCHFDMIADPAGLAAALSVIPGLLGHGLFLTEIDTLCLGTAEGVSFRDRGCNIVDK